METEGRSVKFLFNFYRDYIGEPDTKTDIYLGFGLFLGGIGLGIIGLLLFLWSSTLEGQSAAYYAWVKPSYAISMVALPVVLLGIIVLLPAKRHIVFTGVAGAILTLVAVVGFTFAYPDDWYHYGADYTVPVVATYAIGVAGISAATGASLIAHYLTLAREAHLHTEGQTATGETETIDDETIRRDIEEAMEDVELSWGGVEKTEHQRLQFVEHEFEGTEFNAEAKTIRSQGVDKQVAGLKGLKGGEKKTTKSPSTVDNQTAKLKELRERQQSEQLADSSSGVRQLPNSIRNTVGGQLRKLRSAVGNITLFNRK